MLLSPKLRPIFFGGKVWFHQIKWGPMIHFDCVQWKWIGGKWISHFVEIIFLWKIKTQNDSGFIFENVERPYSKKFGRQSFPKCPYFQIWGHIVGKTGEDKNASDHEKWADFWPDLSARGMFNVVRDLEPLQRKKCANASILVFARFIISAEKQLLRIAVSGGGNHQKNCFQINFWSKLGIGKFQIVFGNRGHFLHFIKIFPQQMSWFW